ncbi:MAG: hypothetical protein ABJG47_04100 [Ekhidna sp.]
MKKILFAAFFLIIFSSSATHIRGGQIQSKMIGARTVEFTFIGYRDIEGVPFGQGIFYFGDGDIYGDDNTEIFEWEVISSGSDTEIWSFKLIHTYESANVVQVSYSEDFRSSDIVNVVNSVSTSFHVEAMITFDPLIGITNSSPTLIVPPNFIGVLNGKFTWTFAHSDSDGDSLTYKLVTPLQAQDLMVNGYYLPNRSDGEIKDGIFELNPFTGNLVWDKIEKPGSYLVAVKVEEWRKVNGTSVIIGYSVLDFVIDVSDAQSPFIELTTPPFTCLEEGENFQDSIIISNQSNLELDFQFLTDIEALKINGMTVNDWNASWMEDTFTESQIQLNLTITAQELEAVDNLGHIIFEVKGYVSTEQMNGSVTYSTNRLVAVGCDETNIVLTVPDEPDFWTVDRDGVEVVFKDNGRHQLAIYSLEGVMLRQVSNEKSSKINLVYPFVENTVYVILLHSSTGITTKKIHFTPKF